MPVLAADKFEGHAGSTFHGVFNTTGRTEAAPAPEWDEFGMTTVRTFISGTTERRGAAIDHLVDVFDFDRTGVKGIYDFFIMIGKDSLEDVHTIIMKEK